MMPSFNPGDVVLVTLQFTAGTGSKRRPALVLLDLGEADLIVVPVTSHAGRSTFDISVHDWRQARLLLPSVVRVHKPTTIEKKLVERTLGTLSTSDWAKVRTKVLELWNGM